MYMFIFIYMYIYMLPVAIANQRAADDDTLCIYVCTLIFIAL
jgi:hypothetical protein